MSWHDNAARNPSIGPLVVVGRDVGRARGYSRLELRHVGISEAEAAQRRLPVDAARKSLIGCNVMQLRALLSGRR